MTGEDPATALLALGGAAPGQDTHRLEHDGVTLTWNRATRVALLRTRRGHRLTGAHGIAIGRAIAGWAGSPPSAPYAFVVRGEPVADALTDQDYRRILGRGARGDVAHIRLLFYGGTDQTRFIAGMYLRAVGALGAVVETEAEALAWLEEQGFA